jgi:hypothetical protein
MDRAAHCFQIYQTLRAANRANLSDSPWFDVVFTPTSLQHRLQEQNDCFTRDAFGGLRCYRSFAEQAKTRQRRLGLLKLLIGD